MQTFKDSHFDGQEENETILRIVRRHWFNIFSQYVPIIVVVFLLVALIVMIPLMFPEFWKSSSLLFWFFETMMALIMWVYAALIFVDYVLDVWIITDRRVVNVEQKGLFMREVSELRHQKIQDVTTDVDGFFPTFLNYGEVLVQTAAEQSKFCFHNVPEPYEIKALLVDLQKRAHRRELNEVKEVIREEGA